MLSNFELKDVGFPSLVLSWICLLWFGFILSDEMSLPQLVLGNLLAIAFWMASAPSPLDSSHTIGA